MANTGQPSDKTADILEVLAGALLEDALNDEAQARVLDAHASQSRRKPVKWMDTEINGIGVTLSLLPQRHEVEVALKTKSFRARVIGQYDPEQAYFDAVELVGFSGDEDDALIAAEAAVEEMLGEGWDDAPGEIPAEATDDEIFAVDEAIKVIRKEMRRGRMRPEVLADLMDELITMPGAIWAMVDGYAAALADPKPNPTGLSAWRMLFIAQLRHLRDHLEAETDGAEEMLATLVDRLAELSDTEDTTPEHYMALTSCLHEARIALDDEARTILVGGTTDDDDAPVDQAGLRAEFAALLDQIVADESDPFVIAEGLSNILSTVPDQAQRALAEQFGELPHAPIREMLPLLLLAEHAAMREAAADVLTDIAAPATMSPVMLRRMAAARNWVAPREQGAIDRAIERASDNGVVAAPWPEPKPCTILASMIDASGAGMVVMTFPPKRPRSLLALALRQGGGIEDAQIGSGMRVADINDMIVQMKRELAAIEVSQAWLDRVVSHLIAAATSEGETPPPNLLFVAEEMGGQAWQATALDVAAECRRLSAGEADIARILADSALLMKLPIAANWFLDDVAVDNALAGDESADREAVVLREVLEPIRSEWGATAAAGPAGGGERGYGGTGARRRAGGRGRRLRGWHEAGRYRPGHRTGAAVDGCGGPFAIALSAMD